MSLAQRLAQMPVPRAGKPPGRRVNCHIHLPPNFSAFENVEDALGRALEEGLLALGISNYYDFAVYTPFVEGAMAAGVYPLLGIEVLTWMQDLADAGVKANDHANPGKAYLCGKAIARAGEPSKTASRALDRIRSADEERMDKMAYRLSVVFTDRGLPTVVTSYAISALWSFRHDVPQSTVVLQERHLAEAFQEHVFGDVPADQRTEILTQVFEAPSKADPEDGAAIQGEIRNHLMKVGKPAYAEEEFVSFAEGVRLVLDLGGIPSYPVVADGASPLSGFEASPGDLIENLLRREIHAAEFIPNRNSPETLRSYVLSLRDAGFVVTAGTEHNTRDRIPLVPRCKSGEPVPEDVDAAFFEGACILAAHQRRVALGEPGLVDSEGRRIGDLGALRDEGAKLLGVTE